VNKKYPKILLTSQVLSRHN